MKKLFCALIAFPSFLFAQSELSKTCIDISFTQGQYSELGPQQLYDHLNQQDIPAAINGFIQDPSAASTHWYTMKVPHLYPRMLGLYSGIYYVHALYRRQQDLPNDSEGWLDHAIDFFTPEGLTKVLAHQIHPSSLFRPQTPEALREFLLKPRKQDESGLAGMLKKNPELVKYGCLGMTPFEAKKCESAVNYAFYMLHGTGNTFHIGNGWLVDLMTDHRAAKGGFKLVQKMLKRIKEKDFHNASMLEDAYEAFKSSSMSEVETKKMAETFLILGLVHGQISWNSYINANLVQQFNHATLISAHMMSIVSATLDSYIQAQSPSKQIYMLPSHVNNVCDNGKAYHFLMPWFISRRLSEMNYGPNISNKIGFYFDWMYQVFSTSMGRDPYKNIQEAYNTQRNQSHRLDLMFSAIGSQLGSEKLNVEIESNMMEAFIRTENNVPKILRPGFTDIKAESDPKLNAINTAKIAGIYLYRLNAQDFFNQLNRD